MLLLFLNCLLYSLNLFPLISSISLPQYPSIHFLQFRNTLPKHSQLLLPWNQSTSPSSHCQWLGVSCYSRNNFHVKSLNLSGFGISGILTDSIPSLCHLPHSLSLDLSANNFTGTNTPEFGNCSQLNSILLVDNGITGQIPPELFHSKQLSKLDLGNNFLTGTIPPPEVGLCTNLECLGLNNNLLDGQIPSEFFSLQKLRILYSNSNNLTGALPDFSASCSISDLWIHENAFSNSLRPSLRNCHNLTMFCASSNYIEGIIPPETFEGLSFSAVKFSA